MPDGSILPVKQSEMENVMGQKNEQSWRDYCRQVDRERGILEWTTEKPTVPGWYWFCGRYCSSSLMEHKIMRVYDDEHGGMRFPSADHGPDELVDRWVGQWAGPIPEPSDQQGEAT